MNPIGFFLIAVVVIVIGAAVWLDRIGRNMLRGEMGADPLNDLSIWCALNKRQRAVVAIDMSSSVMFDGANVDHIDEIRDMFARHKNVTLVGFSYEAFEIDAGVPTSEYRNRSGGTNFAALVDFVEIRHGRAARIVVVTDGVDACPTAAMLRHPDRWTWLVAPDGKLANAA